MKKAVAVLLVVVLAFGLCACDQTKKVEKALQEGTWIREFDAMGVHCEIAYVFHDDGSVFIVGDIGGSKVPEEATYSVQKDKIVLTYADGEVQDVFYEYKSGTLTLHMVNGNGEKLPINHTP